MQILSQDVSFAILGRVRYFYCCMYVVVLTGIVWEIWTDGLYLSTLHRVIHKGSNYRYVVVLLNS